MSDMVNHPSHYTATKYEVIDIIEEFTKGLTGVEAVCIGNVIKYVLRYQFKNGVEDLEKARWYLNKVLETKNATGGDDEPPVPVMQDARDIDKTLYTWKDFFLLHGDEARKLGGDRSTCVPNVVCAGVTCGECRKIVLTRREWEKLLTVPDGDRTHITKVFAFEHSMDNYE